MDGLVNLTPHPVAVYGDLRNYGDEPLYVIPPSGQVARVATIDLGTQAGRTVPHELVEYGHVHDLPQPSGTAMYVVSLVVALAVRGRGDLLAPYQEVRNGSGTVVGCRFLQKVC